MQRSSSNRDIRVDVNSNGSQRPASALLSGVRSDSKEYNVENFIWQIQNYSYITPEGFSAVKTYKYNGMDLSYLYNYVLKPMAVFTVQFVPENIAPNVITLAGLFLSLFSCLLMAYHAPFFYGTAPSWVYFVCGMNAFLYQLLDNMDGQQARRTGTSSPLGELFDHGCDALNTTISALVFAAVAQTGPLLGTILILSAWVTFYMATWDEYHTKELYLAPLNGADDGLTVVYLTYFASAILGPEFWLMEVVFGLRFNEIIVVVEVIFTILCSYESITRVESKKVDLEMAVNRLIPLFLISVETLIWILPYNVDRERNVEPEGRTSHLYVMIFTVGCCFAYIVCRIILAHVCSMDFNLEHCWVLIIPMIGAFNHLGGAFLGWGTFIDETIVTYILCFLSLGVFLHYAYAVIRDICDALNISCFSIPVRYQIPPEQASVISQS